MLTKTRLDEVFRIFRKSPSNKCHSSVKGKGNLFKGIDRKPKITRRMRKNTEASFDYHQGMQAEGKKGNAISLQRNKI